jgi:hypothetical protein
MVPSIRRLEPRALERRRPFLLDDDVHIGLLDDVLDLDVVVAGGNRKAGGRAPNSLVLDEAHVDRLRAVRARALTDQLQVASRVGHVLDALVDVSPERLVSRCLERPNGSFAFVLHREPPGDR